jgi:ABC-type transporter Mla subunit MlaD
VADPDSKLDTRRRWVKVAAIVVVIVVLLVVVVMLAGGGSGGHGPGRHTDATPAAGHRPR